MPYTDENLFSFVITLFTRFFLFITAQMPSRELLTEDLQFLALIISGTLGVLLGFYLVYNHLTMLANSISHTVLLGLILTYLIFKVGMPELGIENIPFYMQMIAALMTSSITLFCLRFLSKRLSLEASNALSFTALFAIGILLTSVLLKNTHLGLESVLGNLEAIVFVDIQRLFLALLLMVAFMSLCVERLNVISFDSLFSQAIGIKVHRYKQALVMMASLSLLVCFRSLGVILVLSLLTSPILIARLFASSRRQVFLFGLFVVFIQTVLTLMSVHALYVYAHLPVSTSGLFGFIGLLTYFLAQGIKKGQLKKAAPICKI
jgi:manganese/zinc/iron transport system permease protein